jgi:hypothetical protein
MSAGKQPRSADYNKPSRSSVKRSDEYSGSDGNSPLNSSADGGLFALRRELRPNRSHAKPSCRTLPSSEPGPESDYGPVSEALRSTGSSKEAIRRRAVSFSRLIHQNRQTRKPTRLPKPHNDPIRRCNPTPLSHAASSQASR